MKIFTATPLFLDLRHIRGGIRGILLITRAISTNVIRR